MILTPVNANRNPFIYLNNMGKVMTSRGAVAAACIAIAAAFALGSAARAETGAWAESAHAKARLISAASATGTAGRVQLGLELVLEPGWKTYWRSPGEGGLPPHFDWSGSDNLAHVAVAWPAPRRFEIGGMESLGYSERVILPLEAKLARPGEKLSVRLSLRYAVCREICMLVEANLALDVPAAAPPGGARAAHAEAIAQFQARVPRPGAEHGWRIAGIARKTIGEGAERREIVVVDVANAGASFVAPALTLEGRGFRFGKAMLKTSEVGVRARFVAPMERVGAGDTSGDLVLTLVDGKRAGTFTVALPR